MLTIAFFLVAIVSGALGYRLGRDHEYLANREAIKKLDRFTFREHK